MENKLVKLHNGLNMPVIGLGVYLVEDGDEVYNSIRCAIDAGYRHIDTAAVYENEDGTGKAIADCGVLREELFVTTKLWNTDQGYDSTITACENSLRLLRTDYVDLYLIHWPGLDEDKRLQTWEAMIKLLEDGKTKAIGVSNFEPNHIEGLIEQSGIVPVVNQVELHSFLSQKPLREYCANRNIAVTSWGPLLHGHLNEIPEVDDIAIKYNKSRAQVVLRWHLQNGLIIIPKSIKQERIIENSLVFDFELDIEDMSAIDAMNKDLRFGPDPCTFDFGFN